MLALLIPFFGAAACSPAPLQVDVIDPLIKLEKQEGLPRFPPYVAEVARGEYAEWEVNIRPGADIENLKVEVTPLAAKGAKDLGTPRVREMGYVLIDQGVKNPAHDQLAVPAEIPDPLYEEISSKVAANTNEGLWIDLDVPRNCEAGTYESTVTISGTTGGSPFSVTKPLQLHVFGATVGRSRLWNGLHYRTYNGHMGNVGMGTPGEHAYLLMIAKTMAAHRQNVADFDPQGMSKISFDASGKLSVDFTHFDEVVQMFKDAGVVGRIEGSYVGTRLTGDWNSQMGLRIRALENGKVVTKMVAPDSPEGDRYYAQYFPLLIKHLKEKGWLDSYMQHVCDEPIDSNYKTYLQCAAIVRKYAPELKTCDAVQTKLVAGAVDISIPELDFLAPNFEFYKGLQRKGEEVWFYTAWVPQGEYANRLIELPLIKTRILHWINFRYGISGYSHWGFNAWDPKQDPLTDVTQVKDGNKSVAAGDAWIVYPKNNKLEDSVRYEAERDGIADFELLSMLHEKNEREADRIAEEEVKSFTSYETDPVRFRALRRSLLEALGR